MLHFTNGNWHVSEEYGHIYVCAKKDVCAVWSESFDDARLIAAAPEMYELLKVWTTIGAQPTLRIARERAKELLERIEGENNSHT